MTVEVLGFRLSASVSASADRQIMHGIRYDNSLTGQTAVVTGSSSGIGRAIALELARAGADVLVHARQNRPAPKKSREAIRSLGPRRRHVLLADLSEPAAQDEFVRSGLGVAADRYLGQQRGRRRADRRGGQLVVRREAGRACGKSMSSPRCGCRAPSASGCRSAVSGVILNMGWDQAETGMAGDSGEMFAAAKGAVMAATRSLAKSLAPEVRVNCLAPGWIRTEWGEQASDDWQERARARIAAAAAGASPKTSPARRASSPRRPPSSSTVRLFRSTAAAD